MSEWFAWKHFHPREAEDPSAVWAAAYKAGGRAAIANSAQVCDLVPQLRELLYLLEDGAIEVAVRASDRRFWDKVGIDPDYEAAHDAWESVERVATDDCWVSW